MVTIRRKIRRARELGDLAAVAILEGGRRYVDTPDTLVLRVPRHWLPMTESEMRMMWGDR
jgi:hypothetical protein